MSKVLGTDATNQNPLPRFSILQEMLVANVDVPAVFAREVCSPMVERIYKSPSPAGKVMSITELLLDRH